MTRKHFQAIADVLNDANYRAQRIPTGDNSRQEVLDAIEGITADMATAVGQFNANFNRARFTDACTACLEPVA